MALVKHAQRLAFAFGSRVAPRSFAEAFYRTWGSTTRSPLLPNEVATVASATRRQLTLQDNQVIETYEWGQGPVALLVHGWHGRASQLGDIIKHLCSAGYKVVAFDAPGHGLSAGERCNLLMMTDAVERIAARYEAVELAIAHSFGCLATARSVVNGSNIKRVSFVAPPESLRCATEGVLDDFGMSPRAREILFDLLGREYGQDIWRRFDFLEIGTEVGRLVEARIIHDLNDREVHWKQGKKVSDSIPGSRFLETNGLGHRRILRSKKLFELIEDRGAAAFKNTQRKMRA